MWKKYGQYILWMNSWKFTHHALAIYIVSINPEEKYLICLIEVSYKQDHSMAGRKRIKIFSFIFPWGLELNLGAWGKTKKKKKKSPCPPATPGVATANLTCIHPQQTACSWLLIYSPDHFPHLVLQKHNKHVSLSEYDRLHLWFLAAYLNHEFYEYYFSYKTLAPFRCREESNAL